MTSDDQPLFALALVLLVLLVGTVVLAVTIM